MYETGHFATLWRRMASRLGLEVDFIPADWRRGADPEAIGAQLEEDRAHEIKAVCVVHNETSTGAVTRVAEVRRALDRNGHPALLIGRVFIAASIDYRMDEWGVDVTIAVLRKGRCCRRA
jgi:alanine-glyoxylate transaminase/serine-glyoxylate transaminase/serine-pyruvate transaminase